MTRALHAEWTKLRTVPSTLWSALAVVVFTVAIGALATAGLSTDECGDAGTSCDTARIALAGVYLGQAAVVVLAVLAMSPEYETLMIRTTLAAEPLRTRVLAAKASVVTVIALVAGILSVLGSFAVGRMILSGKGFHPLSLGDGPTMRAFAGTALYCGLIALLALGVGTIIRHTGGTITVVLSLLYTPPIVASLVTDPAWQARILRFSPMTAGLAIQATLGLDVQPISPWKGLGVLTAYAAATLLAGTVVFLRRDA